MKGPCEGFLPSYEGIQRYGRYMGTMTLEIRKIRKRGGALVARPRPENQVLVAEAHEVKSKCENQDRYLSCALSVCGTSWDVDVPFQLAPTHMHKYRRSGALFRRVSCTRNDAAFAAEASMSFCFSDMTVVCNLRPSNGGGAASLKISRSAETGRASRARVYGV